MSNQNDRPLFNFPRADGANRLKRRDIISVLADSFDNFIYKLIPGNQKRELDDAYLRSEVKEYLSNSDYWRDTLLDYNYIGQKIVLDHFSVIEWLPASPGLFFTGKAHKLRQEAEKWVAPAADEFLPLGKINMVGGGIGSVRLGTESIQEQPMHFLCATSNGASHEGIPLVIKRELYLEIIDQIKEQGYCKSTITGTIELLPVQRSIITFDREIPKYCVVVESVKRINESASGISVTIAAAFQSDEFRYLDASHTTEEKFAWTYCTFTPGRAGGPSLQYAVEWLQDYANRYFVNPRFITDFDAHIKHFQGVDFKLAQIMSNSVDENELRHYIQEYNLVINKTTLVMGDVFNNVSGTIVNRSVIENSLNIPEGETPLNRDLSALMEQLNELIIASGNKDAIDHFRALKKELKCKRPRRSLLLSFWMGIERSIPDFVQHRENVIAIFEQT
jgi:hypothetical protein